MKDTVTVNLTNVKMVAHRGVSLLERENTCAAFVAAGQRSYWGVECDVYRTADGHFLVSHDGSTKRCAGVDYRIEETDLATLRSLTMQDLAGNPRGDLIFPTLEEYISVCKYYDKYCVLELKSLFTSEEIDRIIAIIDDFGWLEHTVFISFSPENCVLVREKLPQQRVQQLKGRFDDEEDLLGRLLKYRLDLDIFCYGITKEQVALCHKNGIEVNIWTVDSAELAQQLADWGVDYITSNILE